MHSFVVIYQDSFATEYYFGDAAEAEIQFVHLIQTRQFARAIYFYGPTGLINDWNIERTK